jgi:predicted RNase H-like nuclease (RuvC/YqgF family)
VTLDYAVVTISEIVLRKTWRASSKHSMSSLVCGLDIHKNSVYATVMSYSGEVVEKRKLCNNEVANFLDRYPIDKVAMESSTSIVPIYRTLREKGYTILVSHPKKTRLIAESRIKTDRVDSWAVTELARLNALPGDSPTNVTIVTPTTTLRKSAR